MRIFKGSDPHQHEQPGSPAIDPLLDETRENNKDDGDHITNGIETKGDEKTRHKDNATVEKNGSAEIGDVTLQLEDGQEKTRKRSTRRCDACRKSCYDFCRPCMTKHYPPVTTRAQRVRYAFMCPPHGKLGRVVTSKLTLILLWGVLWAITRDEALPGGNFFGLLVLFLACKLGGFLVSKIRLPPLLGMLIVGCLLRNVPYIDVAKDIKKEWSSSIRSIALVVILIKAALGLDPKALRRLSHVVARLAFIPCGFEAVSGAVAGHFLLGFPWDWSFMLGFVMSAVSPAVVVPSMLQLQEQGLGVDKGIPTAAVASGSVENVVAISAFGVVLGIAFSKGDLAFSIIRGPLEALTGIVYGVVGGLLCWYIPNIKHRKMKSFRTFIVTSGGLLALFGSNAAKFPGAGALGCLTMAFVASLGWRKQGWTSTNPVAKSVGKMWLIFQPLLFGLIGAEIDISKLDGGTVGIGLGVLGIGLTVRCIGCVLAVVRTDFNLKERLFVPIAWLPKATVQAAIGSVALDTARRNNATPEEEAMGNTILTLAVLAILATAPIGAALISLTAPRLLHQTTKEEEEGEDDKKEKADEKAEVKEDGENDDEEEEETPESEVESDEEQEEEELEKVEHMLDEAVHDYDVHHPHPHHLHHPGDHGHQGAHAHHHHHHHHHHHQDETTPPLQTGDQTESKVADSEAKQTSTTDTPVQEESPLSVFENDDESGKKTAEMETVNEKIKPNVDTDKDDKTPAPMASSETLDGPHVLTDDNAMKRGKNSSSASQIAASVEDGICDSKTTFSCSYDENKHKRKCAKLRDCCYQCTEPCMTETHPLPPNPTRGQRLKYALMCPLHGHVGRHVTLIVAVLLLWAVLWAITGDNALPGGNLFGLLILLICAQLGGNVVELIRLPPLLGMLLVGVALKNIPHISFARDIDRQWSVAIRSIALAVILLKAALGLDSKALKKSSASVLKLAFLPCLSEAIIEAVVAHFLLGFPWDWSFMLGFVLSAVSPAVVVPSMLHLQEQGLGVDKGIPTIAVAAASIENVFAISLFGVLLGIAFSHGQLVQMILQGPLEVLMGVTYGVLVGIVCWYFPYKKHKNLVMYRTFLLCGAGLFALFGSVAIAFPGAGALGCLTMAFTAAVRWRKEECNDITRIKEIIAQFWMIFQPFLFGLIGAEIDFKALEGSTLGRTTGLGLAVLGVGLCLRSLVAFLIMLRSRLNMKERFFVMLSWLPKATVQAAIGSIALDTARDHDHGDQKELWGLQILTIAVLSILVTAPIGAAAIALTAPRLLYKTPMDNEEKMKIIGSEIDVIKSISLEDLQEEPAENKDVKKK